MYIESLKFYHFRNILDGLYTFSPRFNLLVGLNGQGKTNVVEALHLLSTGRSFRTSNLKEVIAWNEKEGSVFGKVQHSVSDRELGLSFEGRTREAFVNGEKAKSLVEFVGKLLTVVFSPGDLSLVKGAPALRRKFLDKHAVDLEPGLLRYLLHYSRALKHKNALLREDRSTSSELDAWDRILSESGARIMRARRRLVNLLGERATVFYRRFCAEPDATFTLSLETTGSLRGDEDEAGFAEALLQERHREISARSALIGPHRDDLKISINNIDARAFASQGEARSAVLAMKLAVTDVIEAERGDKPLLLLDDVDSELDPNRVRALLELIFEGERQVFLTSTKRDLGDLYSSQEQVVIEVSEGKLTYL